MGQLEGSIASKIKDSVEVRRRFGLRKASKLWHGSEEGGMSAVDHQSEGGRDKGVNKGAQ